MISVRPKRLAGNIWDGSESHLYQLEDERRVEVGPSLLIRPDACAAWAGDGDDTGGLEESLHRWFQPAPAAPEKRLDSHGLLPHT